MPMRSPVGACVVRASTTPSEYASRSEVASADLPRTWAVKRGDSGILERR